MVPIRSCRKSLTLLFSRLGKAPPFASIARPVCICTFSGLHELNILKLAALGRVVVGSGDGCVGDDGGGCDFGDDGGELRSTSTFVGVGMVDET